MSYSSFCVWGPGFADLLAPYNPDQNFIVSGNHIVTCRRLEEDENRGAIGFFLQKGAHLMTERAWRCMLELISWAAVHFPEVEIRVRPHPSSPLTADELAIFEGPPNVNLMLPECVGLNDTLSGCRVIVAMDSTTILEGAASGAVPLILSVNGFDHYQPNIAADGGAVDVRDFSEARSALSKIIREDDYRRAFSPALDRVRQRFFARSGKEALAAIAAEIEKLAKSGRRLRAAAPDRAQ
jgi:hypothetical protein